MMRIIWKVTAELNMCIGNFMGKNVVEGFKQFYLCGEQEKSCPNRLPVDKAMKKLLNFVCA